MLRLPVNLSYWGLNRSQMIMLDGCRMSDDSTKPAEVTPEAAAVVMKPEEPAVKVSPEEAQAWLEKSERFAKLVVENLPYGE